MTRSLKHLTLYWKLELDFLKKKKPTLTNEIKWPLMYANNSVQY